MTGYNEILKSLDLSIISQNSEMDANLLNKNFKLRQAAIFNTLREANPQITSKDLARQMGTSTTTLQRIRKDLNMASPYRYDISKSKKKKVPQIVSTPRKTSKKRRGKNEIGGSDVNEIGGDDVN